jgi:hypothetical protein
MSFETAYISTSANRYSHCSDVAPDGSNLVLFGAGRGVAVWDSAVRPAPSKSRRASLG